jgi:hypothetical protein
LGPVLVPRISQPVGEVKADEIAAKLMTTVYRVQIGAMVQSRLFNPLR